MRVGGETIAPSKGFQGSTVGIRPLSLDWAPSPYPRTDQTPVATATQISYGRWASFSEALVETTLLPVTLALHFLLRDLTQAHSANATDAFFHVPRGMRPPLRSLEWQIFRLLKACFVA